MQKKRTLILTLATGLFLMGFISAYSTSGIFSLTGILDSLDPSNIFLGGIFLIAFAMLNMVLSKFFKDSAGQPNTTVAGVVAFVLSVFIIYGLNRTGFEIQGFFFDLGISSDTLYPIVAILLIAGSIFVIAKFGLRSLLAILGGFFILASFFVYEAEAMLILGILFEVAAFLLWAWNKKKARNSGDWETLRGAGRGAWGGAKAAGRGALGKAKAAGSGIKNVAELRDPRNRLERYHQKMQLKTDKNLEKKRIKGEKDAAKERLKYKNVEKARVEAIKEDKERQEKIRKEKKKMWKEREKELRNKTT